MNNNFTLTDDDLKVLKLMSKYIKSYGHKIGRIDLDVHDMNHNSDGYFDQITQFSNHWDMDIPEFFEPLLKRLMKFSYDNQVDEPEYEHINYNLIEITIGSDSVTIEQSFAYEADGDSRGLTWDIVDNPEDESLIEVFNELEELESLPKDDIRVEFNGSGDSGYLENEFAENNVQVPAVIETWCYDQLENNFGGWEINEGSFGYFKFDLINKTIDLEYTERTEEHVYDEILNINF